MSNIFITSLNCSHHILFSPHKMSHKPLFSNTQNVTAVSVKLSGSRMVQLVGCICCMSVITVTLCQGPMLSRGNAVECEAKMEHNHLLKKHFSVAILCVHILQQVSISICTKCHSCDIKIYSKSSIIKYTELVHCTYML